MHFSYATAALLLAGAASAAEHTVTVGKDGLKMDPPSLKAAQGDTVTFHFFPNRHNVVQSTFAAPCAPSNNGFYSGFMPTTSGASEKTFTIEIKNASAPIWYYCSAMKHCQNGMVGVINPPASGPNTLEAYTTSSAAAAENKTPTVADGQGGKIDTHSSGSPSGSAPSGTSTGPATAQTTTPNAASPLSGRTAAQLGAIAALVAAMLM